MDPNVLLNGGKRAGIEELSEIVEELILMSGESAIMDTSKCGGLTLLRMMEAFPLART